MPAETAVSVISLAELDVSTKFGSCDAAKRVMHNVTNCCFAAHLRIYMYKQVHGRRQPVQNWCDQLGPCAGSQSTLDACMLLRGTKLSA